MLAKLAQAMKEIVLQMLHEIQPAIRKILYFERVTAMNHLQLYQQRLRTRLSMVIVAPSVRISTVRYQSPHL